MSNWRIDIKTLFANLVCKAIDIKKFGGFNNQKDNSNNEETVPTIACYFEYSAIGDGLEYLLQRDIQQSDRVPVEVTLHIMFNCFNEQAQDLAYQYADKITCEIKGIKNSLIHGRIMKVSEQEDTSHRAKYDYQISFAFFIKEAVFVNTESTDVNPIDITNTVTGRRLLVNIDESSNT